MLTIGDEPSIPVTVSLRAIPGNNPILYLTLPCLDISGSFLQLWKAEERKGKRPPWQFCLKDTREKKKVAVSKGKNPISVNFEKRMADDEVIDHNVCLTEKLEQER